MAPYLRSTVDGVLPVRRLVSLHLAHTIAKRARQSRGAAARATSHHQKQQRATCACVLDGSTERTGVRRSRRPRAGAERGGPAQCRPPNPSRPGPLAPRSDPARKAHIDTLLFTNIMITRVRVAPLTAHYSPLITH
ncbi:unnamed protein product [Pieris brassicae]|uniref:Uncharacterized protein n=1 Tax=Pieris brassicae TaxID=7116 RepID=A0A9P0T4I2_PIEBR|nr:unnamed protein product [Pieris brassicae]